MKDLFGDIYSNKFEKRVWSVIGIIMAVIIALFLLLVCSGCTSTKYTYPTYAENAFYPTAIPVVSVEYDTVVSVKGDTTLLPVPYEPTKAERIVANTMLSFICGMIIISVAAQDQ